MGPANVLKVVKVEFVVPRLTALSTGPGCERYPVEDTLSVKGKPWMAVVSVAKLGRPLVR